MRRYSKSPWKSTVFGIGVPVLIGGGCAAALDVLFAVVTFYVLGSMQFIAVFTAISLAAGAYVSGTICGKYRRRSGLTAGMTCGLIMYIILFIAAISAGTAVSLWKLFLLCIAGAVGGIKGVNSERPKNLM